MATLFRGRSQWRKTILMVSARGNNLVGLAVFIVEAFVEIATPPIFAAPTGPLFFLVHYCPVPGQSGTMLRKMSLSDGQPVCARPQRTGRIFAVDGRRAAVTLRA